MFYRALLNWANGRKNGRTDKLRHTEKDAHARKMTQSYATHAGSARAFRRRLVEVRNAYSKWRFFPRSRQQLCWLDATSTSWNGQVFFWSSFSEVFRVVNVMDFTSWAKLRSLKFIFFPRFFWGGTSQISMFKQFSTYFCTEWMWFTSQIW